jgi:NAD(P)-dependent dehydrogenase (short-subunit alcohol dehydrogenase family)
VSTTSTKTQAGSPPLWARGIEGQVALVTGAGRGLGRACALALSQAGARVIAVARTAGELEHLAADAAGPVEAWVEDVRGDALLGRIEALAQLDVLVNNAGSNRPQPFLEVTDDALDGLLELNVRAAYRVARSAARVMARAGRGSIVHMSSQMGHVGSPQRSVYCMTKHAIEGLSKAMAVELAPLGIRVNTVAPTFVDTPMTRPYFENPAFAEFVMGMIPAKRLGTLEEVAAAVLYLASPASGIVTGTSLRLDGGWTAH